MASLHPKEDQVDATGMPNVEKPGYASEVHGDYHDPAHKGNTGGLLVVRSSNTEDLKLAKNGKTVLIPQPSDDRDDVLN